jgi:succinate dehydrogenase / fumarate reductase flavoprotein subunit
MSESLRNDGRIWVPRKKGDERRPRDIPEDERFYYLEERYPSFGNLVPRDVASRAAKKVCDEGYGLGETGFGVYLDFRDAIKTQGKDAIEAKYGNLFDMYRDITDENPYETPFRIYPAPHYTMGGLWVDYNLMTNIPGLYAIGEANFSDHGANRLGASSLMQCLADGYFILPQTIGDYLRDIYQQKIDENHPEFAKHAEAVDAKIDALMSVNGNRTPLSFQKELGDIMWQYCGMSRNAEDLKKALDLIPKLRKEFWSNVKVAGTKDSFNQSLERAGRVADFLEFGELMCKDALERDESCGCHLREEHVHEDGEAKRDDDKFAHVAAWEWQGEGAEHELHREKLIYDALKPTTRSYK